MDNNLIVESNVLLRKQIDLDNKIIKDLRAEIHELRDTQEFLKEQIH